MKASVKPRSPALNAVGTAQVHGYRKSLFWWNVWSGSRKAVRHSHTCQTQPESFPWDQARVRKTPAEKNAPPIFFQTCLEAYVLPRIALELTVAILPLIASWNRFERVPVFSDLAAFNAE